MADFYDDPPLPGDYVVSPDGVRLVRPYPFDFACHVKKRHVGADVARMFAEEFPARPRRYYERGVRARPAEGRDRRRREKREKRRRSRTLRATGRRRYSSPVFFNFPPRFPVPERRLRRVERRRREQHRKRKPALSEQRRRQSLSSDLRPASAPRRARAPRAAPPRAPTVCPRVEVVAATASVVAVHKPATVPAHPTGSTARTPSSACWRRSGRTSRLFPVHRLDKNVSGLLLLARDGESATRMCEEVARREVRKEYLALVRVSGPSARTSRSLSLSLRSRVFFIPGDGREAMGVPPAPGVPTERKRVLTERRKTTNANVPPNVVRGKASRSSPTGKSSPPPSRTTRGRGSRRATLP